MELLLLGQLAQVGRPFLLCAESIAGEVERRELALLAAKQAVDNPIADMMCFAYATVGDCQISSAALRIVER